MSVLTTPADIATSHALRRRPGADVAGAVFKWLLIGATVFATGFLAVLLAVMIVDGWDVLSGNLWHFLTHGFSQRSAAEAGVWQGIIGSLQVALVTGVFAVPIGVATAIYLVEYAQDSRFARIVELNIRNLAGVPSIVYGLLGLAVFVQTIHGFTQGKTVIAGGMTLAAMVLPIIVIEGSGAVAALKKSGSLLRSTWGENLAAQFGMSLIGFLLILPGGGVVFLGISAGGAVGAVGLLIGVIWIIVAAAAVAALSAIYQTALYHFAVAGSVPSGYFDQNAMQMAFRTRRR